MASKDFPPKIPDALEDLDRVVMLLGSITNGLKLKAKKVAELEGLISTKMPNAKVAALWKMNLKKLRAERKLANQATDESAQEEE